MATWQTTIDRPRGAIDLVVPEQEAAQVEALLLLSGSPHATDLAAQVGRCALDLPIGADRNILTMWEDAAADLASYAGTLRMPVRVLACHGTPMPTTTSNTDAVFEPDSRDCRGAGGRLRDAVCGTYPEQSYVLAATAAQILTEPLHKLVAQMASTGGDAVVVSHEDGTPSGLMLIRAGCLRAIADEGFVDMKEQALPLIAKRYRVTVLSRKRCTGLPVRTLAAYIDALRWLHRPPEDRPSPDDAYAEDWRARFAVVEKGTTVDPTACIIDSVVLAGARVERGATVARSVICPNATVRRNTVIVDQTIA